MAAPRTYADHPELVADCVTGQAEAWRALRTRFERQLEAVVVRVVDERRGRSASEVPRCLRAVMEHLERDGAEALRAWTGASTLGHYLAVVTRQAAREYLQDVTPPATVLASLEGATSLFLDEVLATEPAKRVVASIDRLPPHLTALLRLRLRGLEPAAIGAILGSPPAVLVGNLEKVAARLGELAPEDVAESTLAWRMLLDAAPSSMRVSVALRSEREEGFRQLRDLAAGTWRAVRERALVRLHAKKEGCFDGTTAAAFVDGTLRGTDRTRAEGHMTVCARCIDAVAALSMDMRIVAALRRAAEFDEELALAAASVATGHYRAGEWLAEQVATKGSDRARDLARIGRLGWFLVAGQGRGPTVEPSGVTTTESLSADDAPLVALERVVAGDVRAAAKAIDDQMAKFTLGTRVRLLALVAGHDLDAGQQLAADLLARSHPDPGLMTDAEIALALPDGQPLPREILLERVRDMLPAAVRYVLTRRS